MGDAGPPSESWMPPKAPRALPMGKANMYPRGEGHAVSVSLPTWDSVIGLSRKEPWVLDTLEWSYPRFYINKPVRDLSAAVLRRLQITDESVACMVLSSATAARQCVETLRTASSETLSILEVVRFTMPLEPNAGEKDRSWANFAAVLLPSDQWKEAMGFWRDTGTGLSSRHAEFCLEQFDYLDSESGSSKPEYQTRSQKTHHSQSLQSFARVKSASANLQEVQFFIAKLATSEMPGQPLVRFEDVFLYPNGMNAIYGLSKCLSSLQANSKIAAYGWLYPETVEVLRRFPLGEVLTYKNGTEEELDHLESILKSGQRIHALFCELPSNIKLSSPNLQRIRSLADTYGFIVGCDDTVAGYVNIDALPYVDVMMSSLTKTFSGASNVTGGSLVINPSSRYHDELHAALSSQYENVYFPLDMDTLLQNCQNTVWRIKQCNQNTIPLVDLLKAHPSIKQVNHPSTSPTATHYENVMRKDGGYGNVLSIIFHRPDSAEHFYNTVNVCKGSSFGTNFTLAIPYVQLANYWNRDKVPKYGVPQHIIRISVGLEDSLQLVKTVDAALKEVEEFEAGGGSLLN